MFADRNCVFVTFQEDLNSQAYGSKSMRIWENLKGYERKKQQQTKAFYWNGKIQFSKPNAHFPIIIVVDICWW